MPILYNDPGTAEEYRQWRLRQAGVAGAAPGAPAAMAPSQSAYTYPRMTVADEWNRMNTAAPSAPSAAPAVAPKYGPGGNGVQPSSAPAAPVAAAPAVAGAMWQPPQSAYTYPREQTPLGSVAASRESYLADYIPRLRYLQSKGLATPDMGDPNQLAGERANYRREMDLAERANAKPREVLQPSDNAAIQKGKIRDLLQQIGSYNAKAGYSDPGYNRAASAFYDEYYGSTPGADLRSGKLPMPDPNNPVGTIGFETRMSGAGAPDAAGFAKLGSEMTARQTAGRQRDIADSDVAYNEYRLRSGSRQAAEQYGYQTVGATREANLNALKEKAATSGAAAAEARSRLDVVNDPAYHKIMMDRLASEAGKGQLGLEQSKAATATGIDTALMEKHGVTDQQHAGAQAALGQINSMLSSVSRGAVTGNSWGGAETGVRSTGILLDYLRRLKAAKDEGAGVGVQTRAQDLIASLHPPDASGEYSPDSAVSEAGTIGAGIAAGAGVGAGVGAFGAGVGALPGAVFGGIGGGALAAVRNIIGKLPGNADNKATMARNLNQIHALLVELSGR